MIEWNHDYYSNKLGVDFHLHKILKLIVTSGKLY